ncbi:hypothetical protein M9Y10_010678 [Tritrichomonas musculus]|uniref:Leucine-rich repeat domain-containing protein n=1 Tax=Tritrichomonas musculus TaxID=1915356 RepID=A0ABR2INX5_9EUKA
MKTYLTKEKKNEILDLFSNSNNLLSEEEFKEIKYKLHNACQDGDLELIKILLSETIQDDSKDLTFKIDKTNQTASLFKVKVDVKHVIIPRSIKHDSVDYLVTSITGTDFYVKSIKFLDDSAVKRIYRGALSGMYIEELCFPASLKELKEGWCSFTNSLTKITVSPLNGQFLFNENKCLFGKSDPNKDEFDVLLFASRDIEEVVIPSNIKIISSFAFEHCRILKKVVIPKNSNLETIGSNAFLNSSIEVIFIPPKIAKIYESTFADCRNLTKVEIRPNSNLQSICHKDVLYMMFVLTKKINQ